MGECGPHASAGADAARRAAAPPLTWGVLGTGMVARLAMLPALRRVEGAQLLAVASQDAARASALAEQHGIPRAYGSYAALLDDPAITCVYIALPNDLHREWTLRAAAAGKHVLCEKPLGRTPEEVEVMQAACAAANVRLMEALMFRFHPRIERLRTLLAEGAIGEVRSVDAAFRFCLANGANYRWRADAGGGVALDVGGYCVAAARMACASAPVEALGVMRLGSSGVDEDLDGLLLFPGERVAHMSCSFRAAEEQRLSIAGTLGVIEVPHPAFTAWHSDPAPLIVRRGAAIEMVPGAAADPYALLVQAFGAAVRSGGEMPYPVSESLLTARSLVALRHSAGTGRRERVIVGQFPA